MRTLVLAVVLLAACKPKGLLESTTAYAVTSSSALRDLSSVPGIVTGICHRRVQLDYLADQITAPKSPVAATEWTSKCGAYAIAERTFDSALHAIGAYGVALAAVARDDDASLRGDLESTTKSLTSGLVALSGSGLHEDTLAAVGTPVGYIADAVRDHWKAKRIGTLIAKTHPNLVKVLDKLGDYVRVIKTSQLEATWQAYEASRATLDPKLVAIFDVLLRAELDRSQRRLDALARVLASIRAAHAALAEGWKQGEDSAAATRKQIVQLGVLIAEDLRVFQRAEYQ